MPKLSLTIKNSNIPTNQLNKQNLRRLLSLVIVVFVTPYVLVMYHMLIFSLSLLEPLGGVYETFANPLLLGFSFVFGITGTLIVFNRWEKHAWEHYFSELVASIIVLTGTLVLLLFVSGTAALEYSRITTIPVRYTDIIFLVLFLSFGLLMANIRAVFPALKSIATAIVRVFRSRFVPPYSEFDVTIDGLSRPQIGESESVKDPLGISMIFAAFVLITASIVLGTGDLGELIHGHLNLLNYFHDVLSGDPEKILDGSMGVLDEIVRILDLRILIGYLLILAFSYAYAANAIFFTRLGMERFRARLGISCLSMIALSVLFSVILLVLSVRFANHLLILARSIISVELAALD